MQKLSRVEAALLRVATLIARAIGLAHRQLIGLGRGWDAQVATLMEERDRYRAEAEVLRERLNAIEPACRPRCSMTVRWRILWLIGRYGLSMREAARTFAVARRTLSRWLSAVARIRIRREILPRLVRELVHRLQAENARWGTRRIAQVLARLGLSVSRSSVQRIRREKAAQPPSPKPRSTRRRRRGIRARRPNHVWQVDFLRAGILGFGIHVGVVKDLFSRKVLALRVWRRTPTARDAAGLVGAATRAHRAPRHLISDQGVQFTAGSFRASLKRRRIRHRFGAVRSSSSIAILERFWRTLRAERLRFLLLLLPVAVIQRVLRNYAAWYCRSRPHQGLGGATPNEVYYQRRTERPACTHGKIHRFLFRADHYLPVYSLRNAG